MAVILQHCLRNWKPDAELPSLFRWSAFYILQGIGRCRIASPSVWKRIFSTNVQKKKCSETFKRKIKSLLNPAKTSKCTYIFTTTLIKENHWFFFMITKIKDQKVHIHIRGIITVIVGRRSKHLQCWIFFTIKFKKIYCNIRNNSSFFVNPFMY